ncbi:hypothetical protein BJY00DRAFT_292849 [Aspergillus carlsbadensis]|nr:hypothetical protein BJY00DRAFT_292849 [Aspergillus carlsbadensis]
MTAEAKKHHRRICPIIGSMVHTIDYRLLKSPRRIARRRFQSGPQLDVFHAGLGRGQRCRKQTYRLIVVDLKTEVQVLVFFILVCTPFIRVGQLATVR